VHPDVVRQRFNRLAARRGLPDIRLHDVRRLPVGHQLLLLCVTHSLAQRIDEGHGDLVVLERMFAESSPNPGWPPANGSAWCPMHPSR
jgi:hypothetical protein